VVSFALNVFNCKEKLKLYFGFKLSMVDQISIQNFYAKYTFTKKHS
jgi:hypothetical protein